MLAVQGNEKIEVKLFLYAYGPRLIGDIRRGKVPTMTFAKVSQTAG